MKSRGVITCSDANMLPAACSALLSLRRNLTRQDIRYFLLGIDLDDDARAGVERFSKTHSIAIELLDYHSPETGHQTRGRWSQATMARLYMDLHLPTDIDVLLYVDADVLAVSSVDALFDTDFRHHPLAAVDDYLMAFPEKAQRRNTAIGMQPPSRYFNAGVLLFDWSACIERDAIGRARSLHAQNPERFRANDQDVLNVVFEDAWLRLPLRWNVQTGLVPLVADPAILHFTGRKKPWQATVPWVHRRRKSVYREDLKALSWAGFCKQASFASTVSSLITHIGQQIGGASKIARVRAYFG